MISKWKYLLWPLTILNLCKSVLRNRFFELGIWKSVEFEVPIIYVGSLSKEAGLPISILVQKILGAALHINKKELSLYGFIVGKDRGIYHSVLENQSKAELKSFSTNHTILGLSEWCQNHPDTPAFVMNNEFKQNEIRPALRILVTKYDFPFYENALWPVGDLKLPVSDALAADLIVVCGTPEGTNIQEISLSVQGSINANIPIFYLKNDLDSSKPFNSSDKIEFIQDRDNFERLILNILPNANLDSE